VSKKGRTRTRDATIQLMGKYKPARGSKPKTSTAPAAGLPCVVLLIAGMFLVMIFLYFAMQQ
jgi:hypothetical protein